MGIDILMSYKGMSKEDKYLQDKHRRAHSIEGGSVGFLRASIGMEDEKNVLQTIFTIGFWGGKTPKRMEFKTACRTYKDVLTGYIEGEKIKPAFTIPGEKKMLLMYEKMAQDAHEDGRDAGIPKLNTKAERYMWASNVVSFFEKGLELEKAGKEPKILIRW
jgi:hypothetical protein